MRFSLLKFFGIYLCVLLALIPFLADGMFVFVFAFLVASALTLIWRTRR